MDEILIVISILFIGFTIGYAIGSISTAKLIVEIKKTDTKEE